MSLVALKSKTLHKQNISRNGFSLNGTRRNTSYIGRNIIQNSCTYATNDSTVVKTSTLNNRGAIKHQHRGLFDSPVASVVAGNLCSSEHVTNKTEAIEECVSKEKAGC